MDSLTAAVIANEDDADFGVPSSRATRSKSYDTKMSYLFADPQAATAKKKKPARDSQGSSLATTVLLSDDDDGDELKDEEVEELKSDDPLPLNQRRERANKRPRITDDDDDEHDGIDVKQQREDSLVVSVTYDRQGRAIKWVEGEGVYKVERIVDHTDSANGGERRYFVKWQGFPYSDNTWEPRSNFVDTTEVDAYDILHPVEGNNNRKRRRRVY
jgi:hypothetical protein